jgi:hypothetical protein
MSRSVQPSHVSKPERRGAPATRLRTGQIRTLEDARNAPLRIREYLLFRRHREPDIHRRYLLQVVRRR